MFKSINSLSLPEEKTGISFKNFFSTIVGLIAVFAAIYLLNIEENLNLIRLFSVAASGFCIYAFLPSKFRLPFLFLLNVVAIYFLLGVVAGSVFLVYGFVLFGILNLPFSVRVRTILLIAAAIVCALGRVQLLYFPMGSVVLPVLSGLFMFRAILFLHEQRFTTKNANIWLRLNYFFLLPNLVFVIFPVVDYKIFINNFYTKPAFDNYRKGVMYMMNGVIHLFIYRLIYFYLVPNPTEIQDVYGWLQFIMASYSLIIRLAGIFHLSAGIICLFGFDLPPTFNHYFFANSFSDLWRRVNIYWRTFVMKVFYYPIYFKLKHLGTIRAIAISILITFVFNWLLHMYQWFWVRGTILFTIQDISFWAVFGFTVMLNSVYQAMPRKKKTIPPGFNISNASIMTLRIIGIFMVMAFLWSWWTTPSVADWLGLLGVWNTFTPMNGVFIFMGLVALFLLGIIVHYVIYLYEHVRAEQKPKTSTVYFLAVISIFIIASIGIPGISKSISDKLQINMDPVLHTQLNDADKEMQFKGYYETMLSGNNLMSSPLDEIQSKRPNEWRQLHTLDALIKSRDMITKQLKPNLDISFKGARFQTNSLGLRDFPTTYERPSNTLRMVLLGGSIEMGTGVTTEQTYENIVEEALTRERLFPSYEKVEILIFGVSGIHLPQHIARVDKIVPKFDPQVVIYTAHSDENRRILTNLYLLYAEECTIDYEYLNNLFDSLNLPRDVDESTFYRAVRPKLEEIILWGLSHIKEKAEAIGAIPVWMFVPALDEKYTPEEDEMHLQQAKKLGFYILDLRNFNGDIPEPEIVLGSWDRHPNVKGHELLAEKMLSEIYKNSSLINRINDVTNGE